MRITKFKIISLLTILAIGFIYMMHLTFNVFPHALYQKRMSDIKEENQKLVSVMNSLNARVHGLDQLLVSLQEQDEAMRTYADMPEVEKDIRKLGIGGTRYDKSTELDFLVPFDSTKVSDLLFDIDKLARMVNLEQISYRSLDSTFRRKTAETNAAPAIRPIKIGYFTDIYGYRRDPFTGERTFHHGLDMGAPTGTPIYATADGVVRYAKRRGGYGLVISLKHDYGYETVYAHMSKFSVKPGQRVKRGDVIGEVGNTGRSTASHLHYEVRLGGVPVNPVNYFFSGYLK
ncbi:MAG: peptidoglycan DD-metalloendopeptidase family protein [Candidatus Marinimicrobia bacterium]|nr:peptidoglycan DD-metalloendopeptidase family protein [Candidatus Neomarinimicrobiota bacterium]